jgi:hypothetical protein
MDFASLFNSYFWSVLPLTVYTWIFVLLVRKNIQQVRKDQGWNWSRFLISLVMLTLLVSQLIGILDGFLPVLSQPFFAATTDRQLDQYTLSAGLTISFGLMFAAYINSWRVIQYMPFVYLLGAIWFYYETNIYAYLEYYSYIGGGLALFLMFEVGIRLKDNNSFQLALYLLMEFAMFALPFSTNAGHALVLVQQIFGMLFAYNKLKFFKEDDPETIGDEFTYSDDEITEQIPVKIEREIDVKYENESLIQFKKVTLVEES